MTRARFLSLLFLAVALAGGCRPDSKTTSDPEQTLYLAQTSILSVLANLTRAYTEMNYEEYRKLFDPDFEYIFAPQDVGGPTNIPLSWGYPDELLSAAHIFGHDANRDGYIVESIALTFTTGPELQAGLNPDWRKVVLSNVSLSVPCRDETNGNHLTYMVVGDRADLYFVLTNETAPGTSLHVWKLIRWEDKPIGKRDLKVHPGTWGQIKANFR